MAYMDPRFDPVHGFTAAIILKIAKKYGLKLDVFDFENLTVSYDDSDLSDEDFYNFIREVDEALGVKWQ